jgi:hypothetical protein
VFTVALHTLRSLSSVVIATRSAEAPPAHPSRFPFLGRAWLTPNNANPLGFLRFRFLLSLFVTLDPS